MSAPAPGGTWQLTDEPESQAVHAQIVLPTAARTGKADVPNVEPSSVRRSPAVAALFVIRTAVTVGLS